MTGCGQCSIAEIRGKTGQLEVDPASIFSFDGNHITASYLIVASDPFSTINWYPASLIPK